ncbi:MAG TPA: hypothetical protein VHY08_18410 [Bacillota bacterium]|nr:hypothetical protein [Bacillota bacterium]
MAKEMIGFLNVKNIKPDAVGAIISFEFKVDKFPSDEFIREFNCKTPDLAWRSLMLMGNLTSAAGDKESVKFEV